MLVAFRLAGLSALEAHYAGISALTQSGVSGCSEGQDDHTRPPDRVMGEPWGRARLPRPVRPSAEWPLLATSWPARASGRRP